GQLPSLIAVRQPRPFRRMRWLVWWVKPLLHVSIFLTLLSLSLLLVSQLYAPDPIWFIANGLMLSAIFGMVFLKSHQVGGVWLAVGMLWLVWAQFLSAAGLDGLQWHTIPVGIGLLILARILADFPPQATEILAVDVLMVGSAITLHEHGILSLASVLAGLQVIALAVYGYLDRRAVPFISALIIVAGGAVYGVILINWWLIPFVIGSLLLAGVVLLETRQREVNQWIMFWRERLAI
ncbi:MAG: hypothetical protein JXA10_10845, partial [Anaerolineae bacterium]|nr:hypothetical protein [Anaerolineae bacterium]